MAHREYNFSTNKSKNSYKVSFFISTLKINIDEFYLKAHPDRIKLLKHFAVESAERGEAEASAEHGLAAEAAAARNQRKSSKNQRVFEFLRQR